MSEIISDIVPGLRRIEPDEAPLIARFMRVHYKPAYAYLWTDGGEAYLQREYAVDAIARALRPHANDHDAEADLVPLWITANGATVGWTQWEVKPIDDGAAPGAYLHRLYVATHSRGHGLGAWVLRRFRAFAKTRGLDYCWVEVMSLGRARGLYERAGYAFVREVELPYAHIKPGLGGLSVMRRAV